MLVVFFFVGVCLFVLFVFFKWIFLINYLWYLVYLVVLIEGICLYNREGIVIYIVFGLVFFGDDFLSVFIMLYIYSFIELLISICRSKDMYILFMIFYDFFVLLDGYFLGMGYESWFLSYWKFLMWIDLIKEWVKNNNW